MTIIEAIAHESKLADEGDAYHKQLTDWLVRLLELEIEGEKLRALVRHMYECMGNVDADGNHECYSCEYENDEGKCDFKRRMEELGVETNDV